MFGIPKLLAVDDDVEVVSLLARLLQREFRERIALTIMNDSVAARSWIKEFQPEVIITDLDMPGIDGFALSQDAKRWNPNVQIIVFSGQMDKSIEGLAQTFGATECVVKNGDFAELLSAVERVLGRLPKAQLPASESESVVDNVQSSPRGQASAE